MLISLTDDLLETVGMNSIDICNEFIGHISISEIVSISYSNGSFDPDNYFGKVMGMLDNSRTSESRKLREYRLVCFAVKNINESVERYLSVIGAYDVKSVDFSEAERTVIFK